MASTQAIKGMPADTTIGEVLKKLNACWFAIDENERVILGWAKNWRGHQRNLVREKLLVDLQAKVEGPGADLDDVAPLANMTTGQIEEWLRYRCDSQLTRYAQFLLNRMLWRLYDALSPDAKSVAKTPNGVSLGELNIDALREDFRRLRRYDQIIVTTGAFGPDDKKQTIEQYRAISSAIADPALLHGGILRVKPNPVADGTVYWLQIEFPADQGGFTMNVDGAPGAFPIRSKQKPPAPSAPTARP
jgi:hypothetical protein